MDRLSIDSRINIQKLFFLFVQFSFKTFLVPFITLREAFTQIILAAYLFDLLVLRIEYNLKIFVLIPKPTTMQVNLLWKRTVNILVKLVRDNPLELLPKTSQENGYAQRSLWHQMKKIVKGYLQQSFIRNISL